MTSPQNILTCPEEIQGTLIRVIHCQEAWSSFTESLESLPASRRDSVKYQMDMLVKRLADGQRLSRDSFPPEGPLPSYQGKPAKQFYAFKKIPIRAYGWYSEKYDKTFFISHYIFKNKDKLSKSDTTKVQRNWTRIEVNGDEK